MFANDGTINEILAILGTINCIVLGTIVITLGMFMYIEIYGMLGMLIYTLGKVMLGISRHGNTNCGNVKSVDTLQFAQDSLGISGVSQIGISNGGGISVGGGVVGTVLSEGVTTTVQLLLLTVTTGSGLVLGGYV